jgi:hypothetical protein
VVAVNEVAVNAAGTVTDDGAVSDGFVLAIVMRAPPLGAGCERLMVQVVEAFGPRLVGVQANEETTTDGVSVRVACAELPLKVAVMVALEAPLRVAVVTAKLTELAKAAMVTEAGTLRREFVLPRVMTAPPVGAG